MTEKSRLKRKIEVLITAEQIQDMVKSLAGKISEDYAGKEVVIVPVLKGAAAFFADLAKHLKIKFSVDFISVASYKGAESTGIVRTITDLKNDPAGKDLLLIEDIVDTGNTLEYLQKNLFARRPASVRVCVLLDKAESRKISVKVDYGGFTIPDKFVVGYGLDYMGEYRDLPYIGVLNFSE